MIFSWHTPNGIQEIKFTDIFATHIRNTEYDNTFTNVYSFEKRHEVLENLLYTATYSTSLEIHFHNWTTEII